MIQAAWAIFWIISTLVIGGSINSVFSSDYYFNLDSLVKVSSILIAPLTVGLVFLTKVLAEETQKTRLQSVEPHIVVTIEPSKYITHFNIIIENVGSGTAFDVKIRLDPDVEFKRSSERKKISELSIMSIPVLKPKQILTSYLASYSELPKDLTTFFCESKDSLGRIHTNSNKIDISIYEGLMTLGGNDLEKIANHIEGIRRRFDNVTQSNNRISIDVHTEKDRERERIEWERIREEFYADHSSE
ncbi:hypothetical protein [Azospirillum sp. TSA6c]|uniref:hypothetical protein n=1 Tax=Azospirillum sp. TSA6c TaxID=709813 RepID=UPI0011B4356D|nr:hypothetical protein [Azospirillum sp. TSA6c]